MIIRVKETGEIVHVSDETARVMIEDGRAVPAGVRIVEHAVARDDDREARG